MSWNLKVRKSQSFEDLEEHSRQSWEEHYECSEVGISLEFGRTERKVSGVEGRSGEGRQEPDLLGFVGCNNVE